VEEREEVGGGREGRGRRRRRSAHRLEDEKSVV
jgi:hypothetical protein